MHTSSSAVCIITIVLDSFSGRLSQLDKCILHMQLEHALSKRVMEDVVRIARAAAGQHGPEIRSFKLLQKAKDEIIHALVSPPTVL